MLYEMLAVVRVSGASNIHEVKEIAHTAGTLVLANGGVVRGITNWGRFLLTKPVKRNQARHDSGHHFLMRFDASPAVQELVRKSVAIDPRMVRCGVVKMGGTLSEIAPVGGKVEWMKRRTDVGKELGIGARGLGSL